MDAYLETSSESPELETSSESPETSSESPELETAAVHPPGVDRGVTLSDTYALSVTLPAGKIRVFIFQMLPVSVCIILANACFNN